jgi:glycosyltransferase 2 family protein
MSMVIREISVTDYKDFIGHHPDRTAFHGVAWLEAVARVYGSSVRYLGLFSDDRLQGVCPIFVLRKFVFRLYGCPLPGHATPRLLPLIPDDKRGEALAAFDAWVREKGIRHFQLCWEDPRAPLPEGTRIEILKNLEVPLGPSVEATWKQIKPKARNEIRYAANRHGIRTHWVHSESFLTEYQRLLQSTYAERQGIAPNFPLRLYRALLKEQDSLNLRVVSATQRGKVVAAAWILFDNDRCYWWDGASDHEQRKLSANHLLQWEMLRWCTKRGFKVYDMVGFGGRVKSGEGARPGITQFKESLGAHAVDYAVLYWQTGLLRFALASYRQIGRISDAMKRAWKRVIDPTKIRSKNILKIVRWILLMMVFYFVGRYVVVNANAIENVRAPRSGWLMAACLMGFLSYLVHPYALKALMKAHGVVRPYPTVLGLCYLPWLGKYVPGKIWAIIAGLYLFGKEGIPQSIAAACTMLFMSLNVAACLLITLALGVPGFFGFVGIWPLLGLAVTILLCTSPRILYPAINWVLRWARRPEIDTSLTSWRLYGVLLVTVVSNLMFGLGFTCLVRSFADVPWHEVPHLVGLMVFGEVSGFLALFAPAGIGVREGVLMSGLTPLVGPGPAIVISGAARLWGIVVEFIMIGLGWVALRHVGSKNPAMGKTDALDEKEGGGKSS